MIRRFFCLLGLALVALPASMSAHGQGAGEAKDKEARERGQDSRKLLEEVLMARLTRELALDEEQTVLMVRHLAQYRERMAALRRERMQLARSLREAVRESRNGEEIEGLLAKVVAQDEKIAMARSSFLDAEGVELTAWQKARLFLFVQDFEGDMRKLLKRAQERRQGEHHGGERGEKSGAGGQKDHDSADADTTGSGPNPDTTKSGTTAPGPVQ